MAFIDQGTHPSGNHHTEGPDRGARGRLKHKEVSILLERHHPIGHNRDSIPIKVSLNALNQSIAQVSVAGARYRARTPSREPSKGTRLEDGNRARQAPIAFHPTAPDCSSHSCGATTDHRHIHIIRGFGKELQSAPRSRRKPIMPPASSTAAHMGSTARKTTFRSRVKL